MNEIVTMLTGFGVGMGLIVAIGGQNSWVLGMSVRGYHQWPIASLCSLIDAALMAIGVLLFRRLQDVLPRLIPWLTALGVLILSWLAWQALRKAIRGSDGLASSNIRRQPTLAASLITALAMTLFNPHVYLDTVVLLGSIASASELPWFFWLGSASASFVWFFGLAWAGKPLRQWLTSPFRWRVFDGAMALVLSIVALRLGLTI